MITSLSFYIIASSKFCKNINDHFSDVIIIRISFSIKDKYTSSGITKAKKFQICQQKALLRNSDHSSNIYPVASVSKLDPKGTKI